MKKIEAFVDLLYKDTLGDKKEIQELKAEMKSHLLEAVHELKEAGKTEQEAVDMAIERFGGENEMRAVLRQIFKAQRAFAKWVLYCAAAFLFISLTISGYIWQKEERDKHELSLVVTQIGNVLKGEEVVSSEAEEGIMRLVESTDHISQISIYKSKDIRTVGDGWTRYDTNLAKPDYHYNRAVWAPGWLRPEFYPWAGIGEEWYIEMEFRSFDTFEGFVLMGGMAIFCTLFAVWATVNAYNRRRLNVVWILVFALFNVVGYLVYILAEKRKISL